MNFVTVEWILIWSFVTSAAQIWAGRCLKLKSAESHSDLRLRHVLHHSPEERRPERGGTPEPEPLGPQVCWAFLDWMSCLWRVSHVMQEVAWFMAVCDSGLSGLHHHHHHLQPTLLARLWPRLIGDLMFICDPRDFPFPVTLESNYISFYLLKDHLQNANQPFNEWK